MPLYDYRCDKCGAVQERVFKIADKPDSVDCECGCSAGQVVALGHGGIRSTEAAWLRDVRTVVNKEGGEHCQRFLETPTRENYRSWYKGEGLRPLEPGEGRVKRKKVDRKALTDSTMQRLHESRRIEVR